MRSLVPALLLIGCIETDLNPQREVAPSASVDEEPEPNPNAPIANAGESFAAAPLTTLWLDGTASYDPADLDLIPTWTIVRAPTGSSAVLDRLDSLEPTLFADLPGIYEIELSVMNTKGVHSVETDTVRVQVVPSQAVYVQLTWDEEVDLDLHLLPELDDIWGPMSCSWCNPSPDWGVPSEPRDDPSLDADTIDGYGPETTTILEPSDGTFTAAVHYYGQGGDNQCRDETCPTTEATLEVFIDGQSVHKVQRELSRAGQVWQAFSISWPDQRLTTLDDFTTTSQRSCWGQ